MGVWGQALVEDDVGISTIATTWLLEADHLLSIVRPLESVLARELVDLLGSSRSVRVLLWLGSLAILAVDPVQDRGEDLGRQIHQLENFRFRPKPSALTFHATSNSSSRTKLE